LTHFPRGGAELLLGRLPGALSGGRLTFRWSHGCWGTVPAGYPAGEPS